VEQLRLDRGALFRLSEDGRELLANVTSVRPGEAQPPAVIPLDSIPWMWAQLVRGDVFHVSATSDLPAEAFHERELADRLGVKAVAAVALQESGQVCGLLAFGLRAHEQSWDARILQRIRLISEVIGNALAHLRADAALAASRNETRQLAGRLLTAQEEERKRLAREMHDDVSQRLAANAIQVGQIEQQLTVANPARPALASVREQLSDLSQDVHRISRQLHPSILDDLGLADAIRSECQRWESRSQIAVDFRCGELPADIRKDIALCLFRITQEALRNAARHAQTERIELVLNADAECIRWKVQDYGCGFDVALTRGQPGLGLASMQERARFVGGDIRIESVPGQGTTIVVSLPLPEDPEDGLPIRPHEQHNAEGDL
jgi:signal transduction histidine kinase